MILLFSKKTNKKATEVIDKADVIFTLDFNALHRVGSAMYKILEKTDALFVMVDHHEQPDNYAAIMYSDSSMSSTCEMVYHLFDKLDVLEQLDRENCNVLIHGYFNRYRFF